LGMGRNTQQQTIITKLLEHFHRSGDPKIVKRAQVAILHLKGFPVREIEKICFQKERTIYRWIKLFKKYGLGSIFTGYYHNQNAAKLTHGQKREVKKLLLDQPLPDDFWTIGKLKRYLSARFDIEYHSKQSYYGLLRFCNYSYKLPSLFNIRRDDKFVSQRIKEIRKQIKPLLKDQSFLVFASDETRIEWSTLLKRAWLRKGKKTIIREKQERKYQNFIGFLNLKSGEELLYRLSWQNQDNIIPVLLDLVKKYPDKKIVVIWDNAGFHRGRKIKDHLGKDHPLENIKLINLPPYAPDKNPQELIWRYGKQQIANTVFNQFEKLLSCFETNITGRIYPYHF